jgi:nitrite reductase (NADH) large subunit
VIGCGEVTHRLCELLGDYGGAESLQVSVFCDDLVPDVNWYKQRKIRLLLGERAVRIDRGRRAVLSSSGEWMRFDAAVIATDSPPCIPPIPGAQKHGVFVYRSTEDLAAIREYARRAAVAAVLGGGLLGFEAAKAVRDLGLETHVVELPPRSGPRQLDTESARSLARRVKALGVRIHTARSAAEIIGGARVEGLSLEGAETLTCDLIVISAGNRPHDELARDAGLQIGERGGILVDDQLRTTDRDIFAIGDCALHRETLHGTVAPGYEMVEVCARTLLGSDASLAPRDPASAAE